MTPAELETFLQLTAAIASHQQALDAAVKAKQNLARTLYERNGRHAVYRIGKGAEQLDLTVARTSVGTYYFAPRIRFAKESRFAKAEKKRLDRAARMQSYPTQANVIRPPDNETSTQIEAAMKRVGTEITQAEIEAAMRRGRHDRERSTPEGAAKLAPYNPEDAHKIRLPIVGDVEHPPAPIEPRLLDIQEPSGVLVGDEQE